MTPMGTDIFSILGIRNISSWLASWVDRYENGLALCEKNSPNRLGTFGISTELAITNGYVGYTMQQYITKSKGGVRRPTKAYEKIINNVPEEIQRSLNKYLSANINTNNLSLGDVPHLYSLIPLAQSVSSPLFQLEGRDGIVGSQGKQRDQYEEILGTICNHLVTNIEQGF
jgi:hypothetical protein